MSEKIFEHPSATGVDVFGYAFKVEEPKENIIILTGMEEHAARYKDFAKFLNKQKFNVFVFDHFGQGLTAEGNNVDYGIVPKNFFNEFIEVIYSFVLELKKENLRINIIAHSMGSFMLQRYLQLYSESIDKAVIIGSNGPDFSFKAGNVLAKLTVCKRNFNKKAKFFNNVAFGGYAKKIKNRETKLDWLSYNKENVQTYIADPKCGYMSTMGFYKYFMAALARLHKAKFIKNIDKNIPVLLVAGVDDPVGKMGKGVVKLANLYKKAGLNNVITRIIPNMRHEILNEDKHQLVYEDIFAFLKSNALQHELSDYE